MTERQQRFVDLYNASGNVAEAMEKAGYSPASIKKYGTRLLAQPEVAAAITCAREARLADMTEICTFWSEVMRNPQEDIKNRIRASELLAKAKQEEKTTSPEIENPFATLTTPQLERLLQLCRDETADQNSAAASKKMEK